MASQWRGGPNVKGTLGTLLRTTMHQVGAVKDAAFRQARTQRVWIDGAVLSRRRRDLLAQIGEGVVDRIRQGGAGSPIPWPELEAQLSELDDLEAQIAEASALPREAAPAVSAFGRAPAPRDETARRPEDLRVWRPFADGESAPAPRGEPAPEDTEPVYGRGDVRRRGHRRTARMSPAGGGGIAFGNDVPDPDGDDDLADYMHEDDVPGDGRA